MPLCCFAACNAAPPPATTLHASMRGGFKGCEPLSAGAVFPALAVSCRSMARCGAKASRQAKQKHRAPVRALRRLAACRQRAAAGAVPRAGGGDSRAGADVLPRWHKAASRQKRRARLLMSGLLSGGARACTRAFAEPGGLSLGRAAPCRSLQNAAKASRALSAASHCASSCDAGSGLAGGGNASGTAAE